MILVHAGCYFGAVQQPDYNPNGGPRSEAGRAKSSQNRLTHGLAVSKIIIPGEDPAEFEALLAGFQDDFDPQSNIEFVLVHDLAKFHWLKERAIRLSQQAFFTVEAIDPKHIDLMRRYQTANDNAFQRTLKAIQAMQKERVKQEKQFVSKLAPVLTFHRANEDGTSTQIWPKIDPEAPNATDPPGKVA